MVKVDARGDTCPIPVVKTKKAIAGMNGAGTVETLVDNEIAVQNLTKMAVQSGYGVQSEKQSADCFAVRITVGEGAEPVSEEAPACQLDCRDDTTVLIGSDCMGNGDDKLGGALMKAFIFALSQQDTLPKCILFYNGGAHMTCENSPSIEDLKGMEAQGVEILTCGTCLDFYGLKDSLQVGSVTNMYEIVERTMKAGKVVRC